MKRPGSNARSAKVAARMRIMRQARGWSTFRMADELTKAGHAIRRGAVAGLECGARKYVTVDELCAIAQAFDVAPSSLLDDGPVCSTCKDAPPMHMVCLNCGAEGVR